MPTLKTPFAWVPVATLLLAAALPASAQQAPAKAAAPAASVAAAMGSITRADEVKFVALDPTAAPGTSPQVAVLFGDLKKKGPVAFLAQIPAGYRSKGAHSHSSASYIVSIKGAYHEFAPGAVEGKALGAGGHLSWPSNARHDNLCEKSGGPCLNYAYFPNGFDVAK
jgi:hypothetical protein